MAPPARRNRSWYWLLIVPTVAPLLTPLYNRTTPVLWGMPFFYWYQLGCAVLAIVLIAVVHLATRPRHETRGGMPNGMRGGMRGGMPR
jgi:hypothetical protein